MAKGLNIFFPLLQKNSQLRLCIKIHCFVLNLCFHSITPFVPRTIYNEHEIVNDVSSQKLLIRFYFNESERPCNLI